jgi:hypothetical protein
MTDTLGRASKAQALLENPVFKDAFEGVRLAIIDRIERCPMADTGPAEELRKCLRLLRDVKANVEFAVKEGRAVEFRLAQEAEAKEKRRLGLIPNFFR